MFSLVSGPDKLIVRSAQIIEKKKRQRANEKRERKKVLQGKKFHSISCCFQKLFHDNGLDVCIISTATCAIRGQQSRLPGAGDAVIHRSRLPVRPPSHRRALSSLSFLSQLQTIFTLHWSSFLFLCVVQKLSSFTSYSSSS